MSARVVHAGVSDDLDVLVASLAPRAGRALFTVSAHGGGEAALALAGMGASEVAAMDVEDPASLLRLLELKIAALSLLGREDYLLVMGLRSASRLRRRALARQLIRSLPQEQAAYWRPRRSWLEEGLYRADQVAHTFQWFLRVVRALAPKDAATELFSAPDPFTRRAAFARHIDRPWLRRALFVLGGLNLFFPSNEWHASEYPRAFSRTPLPYLADLVARGLEENPLFAHLFVEGPLPEHLLPPHLRPGAYDRLRAGAQAVQVFLPPAGSSRTHLPLESGRWDGAYLSNVIDYLDPEERVRLFREVWRALKPNAPVLVYSNEAYSKVPLEVGLCLDVEQSQQLFTLDRAHVYRRIELYRVVDPAEVVRRLRVVR